MTLICHCYSNSCLKKKQQVKAREGWKSILLWTNPQRQVDKQDKYTQLFIYLDFYLFYDKQLRSLEISRSL